MRIFCPATLLLPSLLLRPGTRAHNPCPQCHRRADRAGQLWADRALRRILRRCLPVVVHRPPRSGVSPSRSLSAPISETEIRRSQRMGPDAPVWTLVVCPTRRKPGSRQPEQYALDHGPSKIRSGSPAGSTVRARGLALTRGEWAGQGPGELIAHRPGGRPQAAPAGSMFAASLR